MNKTVKTIIVIILIILLIVGIGVLKTFLDPNRAIPENDPNATGAFAGNLYNGGYFTESNGLVYFSNLYDNGCIYSMNPDGTDLKKLTSGEGTFINVIGNYIYYYSSSSGGNSGLGYVRNGRGIYRTDIRGKNTFSIVRAESDSMIVVGNNVYFTNFGDTDNSGNALITFEKISTTGENQQVLFSEHINLGGGSGGNIYFSGVTNDHYLRSYNTVAGNVSTVLEENVYMPIASGGYIFYLDLADDYHLKGLYLADGSINTIVEERIDTYNVYNGIIYYQNVDPEGYALKRVSINGGEPEVVMDGVYKNINITSNYVYFQSFSNDMPIYMTPTNGAVNVRTFDAALDAAMSNVK